MKREILFKAKAINTGEWIESITIAKGLIKRKKDCLFMVTTDERWIGVFPDSISQFVNKKDKNGKKVFEFDYDKNGNCVVWCDNCNSYEFAQIDIPTKDICIPCHRCDGNFFFGDQINGFEIIGNIKD